MGRGHTPLGYRIENGAAVIVPEQAEQIRKIYAGYLAGQGFIEVNKKDADRLGIENGERIIVRSRRGRIETAARVGQKVCEGETWMPFHFPDSPVNRITNAVFDEFARIPEYKVCAVALEKIHE